MLLFSMVENEKDLSKFQRIYDQYKNMMYWVAYDITKNTHDAEDVVQLSLIKLIDILYRIEEEGNRPVTLQKSLDYYHKKHRYRSFTQSQSCANPF